ncbi:MAG: YdcF family protein [Deltaproteobacteria bacterium]|nr:YdcF family protein [Deltaproteobacteria bacterium]
MGGNAKARQEKALDLYNKNYAQKLLLINQSPRYFLKNGVSSSNIYTTSFPASTFDEARYCRKFMETYNVDSAIVVSDWWHLRRVKWSFETFFKGTGKRLIYVPSYSPGVGIWWYLQPHRIRLVLSEWVKLVGYWVIHQMF